MPIEQFPQHVKQLHANVDQGMEDEFQVCIGSVNFNNIIYALVCASPS